MCSRVVLENLAVDSYLYVFISTSRETSRYYLVPRSKNAWSYTSTPVPRLYGVVLKHRNNFTFTLLVCINHALRVLLLHHFPYAFFKASDFLFYLWILLDIW